MTTRKELAAYYARNAEAEREFNAHAQEETGLTAKQWARQLVRRDRLADQTQALARKLEAGGKQALRDSLVGLARVRIHSRTREVITQYRRICILPSMAAQIRAPKLAAAEFFLQRNKFTRFWTFTVGARRCLDTLEDGLNDLNRGLSKLSAYLRETYGIEFVLRCDEFGSITRDAHGPLFHVHAHVLVNSLVGFIPPSRWGAMLDDVKANWGHHWDAGGLIHDVRECVKYVSKPGDLDHLSPEEFGRLHEILFRKKMCQPMGSLAAEIRQRKADKLILRHYRGKGWREVPNQNEQAPVSDDERAAADAAADAEIFHAEWAAATRVSVEKPPDLRPERHTWTFADGTVEHESVLTGGFWAGTEFRQPDRAKDFCRVIARLSPSAGPSGRKEPAVLVMFTRFDEKAVLDHPLSVRLWQNTVQAWESGDCLIREAKRKSPQRSEDDARSAQIRVHTVTPTVRAEPSCSQPAAPPGDENPRLAAFLAQFSTDECRSVILSES